MKTANELQITDGEYGALKQARELLASGKVVWVDRGVTNEFYDLDAHRTSMLFNMSTIRSDSGCQTVCCIGGWMAHSMGVTDRWDAVDFVNNKMSRALGSLCFPEPGLMNLIQPKHAVKAIDNFLNVGHPMWHVVLVDEPVFVDNVDAPSESHRISDVPSPRVVAERQIVNLGRYVDSTEHDAIDRSEPLSESHRLEEIQRQEPLLIDHKD